MPNALTAQAILLIFFACDIIPSRELIVCLFLESNVLINRVYAPQGTTQSLATTQTI